jgi:outer membrane protein TolC
LIPGEFFGQPGEYIPVQFGTNNNLMFSVFLNQLIFDGRYFIGLEYAKSYREMSEKLLNKSEIDVKAMVATTYYNILVLEEIQDILDSNLIMLKKTLYELTEMYNEGFVEVTDVDQLTLTATDIENLINNTELQTQTSYKLLKVQMGIPLENEIVLSQTMDDILAEIDLQAVAEQPFNIGNNIDYNIFITQEQMKLLNLKNEKAAYLPSITGYFSWSENAQDNEFSMIVGGSPYFTSVSVGASLKVPIFSGGYRQARVQQAKLMIEQVKINKVQLEENLELSVFRARSSFITALQNFYKEIKNVQLSRGIYDRTMIKYREGVATSAELTQQHDQFLQAERQYYQTLLLLLNAKNELDKTLGNY